MNETDVTVDNHGSVFLFHMHTDRAREWVETNVSEERQMLGGALAVEARYAFAIAQGMNVDGLSVK